MAQVIKEPKNTNQTKKQIFHVSVMAPKPQAILEHTFNYFHEYFKRFGSNFCADQTS